MDPNVELTLTATHKVTGKKMLYRLIDNQKMILLHPLTNESLIEIDFSNPAEVTFQNLTQDRTLDDAGKCVWECSRQCKGDVICFASCSACCATIIV
jgi:hypothetical protein